MNDYSNVNLQDAALFSALTYAPASFGNAVLWGLTQTGTNLQAAQIIASGQWTDQTQSLASQYLTPIHLKTFSAGGLDEFRVFVNPSSHQVVFVFKGSNQTTSFLSDFTTSDEGFSQYNAIEAAAESLYKQLSSSAAYSSYTFYADGHSLGGAMAQTFALQNNISGFGQNSLPIAPLSEQAFIPGTFSTASQAYTAKGATFQNLVLQGDIATALYNTVYQGIGNFLGTTQWLPNPRSSSEYWLAANAVSVTALANIIPGASTALQAAALADAINAHTIAAFIPVALQNIAPGGAGFVSAPADTQAMQQTTANIILPLLSAINTANLQFSANGTVDWPASIFGGIIGTALTAASPALTTLLGLLTDVTARAPAQPGTNVVSGSATQFSSIFGSSNSNLLVAGLGLSMMRGGTGNNVFIGGSSNTTAVGGSGANTFEFLNVAQALNATMTISGSHTTDLLFVGDSQITGTSTQSTNNKWVDSNGTTYQFSANGGLNQSDLGTLVITNGVLGNNSGDQVTIQNFNLYSAQTSGYMGIYLPLALSINASANAGMDPPAPAFIGGTGQSYTISVNAPSPVSEAVTLTLAGAMPSDFDVTIGDTTEQLNSQGSFTVMLSPGQSNLSFQLTDVTADNGLGDMANGATLQLSASVSNPDSMVGGSILAAPLTFSYVPEGTDTTAAPKPSNVISGVYNGGTGITTYNGDGGDDYITATGASNLINAQNSGNDSIVGGSQANTINGGSGNSVVNLTGSSDTVNLGTGFNTVSGGSGHDIIDIGGGDNLISGNGGTDLIVLANGNNQVYAGTQTSLATAINSAGTGSATGVQGDFISVADGNNTVVGGKGNDLINVGGGNDVIVLGPGNDTFFGGSEVTQVAVNWSTSIQTQANGLPGITLNGVTGYNENFVNPYLQPYNGVFLANGAGPGIPSGPGNDTVYGGIGNNLIYLGNGNNYVETGNGNDGVGGGMGNDTIIAGSGIDTLIGGGGATYIQGGSGTDFLQGGDGNNTVIGGSGNSTILAAAGPNHTLNFAGANLEQNYVYGGSGNDLIQGSAGQDTLIAGTGNTTITGVSGNENITGGSGNDLLYGGTGNNTIYAGGGGFDSLYAVGSSSSTSILYGGNGTDLISGGSGANTLVAGDGGTSAAPTTVAASQTDSSSTTTIDGGAGVDFLEGGVGTSVIYGGTGGTSLAPTSILAYTGNTTVYGGLGTDLIEGGSGTDVRYAGDGGTATAPTTVSGGSGVSTLLGGAGPSVLQDTVSGADLIESGTANDTLVGMGADTLVAGTGNDLLQSNGGSVSIEISAGFGNDVAIPNGGPINLLLGSGILDTDLSGSITFDAARNAYLTLTGDGGSIVIENGLTGGLTSAAYADPSAIPLITLLTDAFGGDQTVLAPDGDTYTVNLGNGESVGSATAYYDTVSSWGNNDTVSGQFGRIYSAGTAAVINSGGFNTIAATGNNATVIGGAYGSDTVLVSGANSLVDVASAANGNYSSSITLSGTNDTVNSGAGSVNSTLIVNAATAVIQVASGAGVTAVQSSVSYTAPTNVASLTLIGSASISATGNAAAGMLTGGAGMDTLIAGVGIDTLVAGSGNTTFVVNSTNDLVQAPFTTTNNAVQSSVSFSLLANINTLTLTGTAALTGSANGGNDTLTSNTGVDTLIGGSGNDTFIINNPLDVVQDTAGTATLVYAYPTNFTLPANISVLTLTGTSAIQATGNAGNDFLTANLGADTLIAGSGTDTLVSGTGLAQTLVGGTGNDLFFVNNAGDLVTVGSTHGADTIQSSVSYSASANVATLALAGTAALAATGNALADLLIANTGADTLIAGSGIATLVGGTGSDTFVVNSGNDVIQDTSTTANNTINTSINYTLPTGINTLVFTGTAALVGTANSANDTLTSNSAADTLVGGAGNDTFVIGNSSTMLVDSSTTSTNAALSSVSYSLPNNVNSLTLTGTNALKASANAGTDILIANAGADTLVAGSGADTLISGAGIDSLVGGAGSDLFILNNAADTVSVGASHGTDTVESAFNATLPSNVSNLVLTGSANLLGTAISGNNTLVGNAGSDTLKAGSGNDMLVAGSGVDTLIGGAASDTFVINNASDVLQSISTVGNTVVSSVTYSMAANVVSLVLEGSANLIGTGNSSTNSIFGNSGNDTLVAGAGPSHLFGGQGADLFIINSTTDTVNQGSTATFAADTIQSSVSFALPNNENILVLTGTAGLTGTANAAADLLIGNAGNDTLTAGMGNDTLIAGSGVATLIGGSGNNVFVINNTADSVQESVVGHTDALFSSVSYSLPANVNTLTLTGSGNLTATANTANDSIRGNAGSDVLYAGSGSDTLAAGSGTATLVGGSGSDTFIVDGATDVVVSAASSTQNVLVSSVSYTLPTNVNLLTLTGVSNISGTGNAAADTLTAGAGQDTLVAGSAATTLVGGSGNDTFVVNSAADIVVDSSGVTSNVIQSSVSESLVTNVNTLVLTGTSGLKGTANGANDTLASNNGLDTLMGGAGNDSFVINNTGDIVQDTASGVSNVAISSVTYSLANNVNTLILMGTAALNGTANGGADTLTSNSGADTLVGGTGNDTFIVNSSLVVVQDSSASATNAIQSAVSYTLPTNVNTLILTGTTALTATGNALNDIMQANSGVDTLASGAGVATLIGGIGNDTFIVNNASDVVEDASTTTINNIVASVNYSLATNVNSLTLLGSSGLVGTANNGNDTLVSNSGVDTLIGGAGNDVFVINNAADVVVNATAGDTIESSVSLTLPAGVDNLTVIGTSPIVATGNAGSAGTDILTAGGGADTIIAGSGIASLVGGNGNDTFIVNNANDTVADSFTSTSNNILSSVSYSLPANVDSLTLTGSLALTATGNTDAANILTANTGNDVLIGTAYSNTLNGGIGSDTIDAGPNTNVIYAGNGGTSSQPTYVYGNASGTNAATQSTIYGGSGVDYLYGGPGSDVIYGAAGPTQMRSGSGFDTLLGAAGNTLIDQLSGYDQLIAGTGAETLEGIGADTLQGGTGNDSLVSLSSLSSLTYDFLSGFGQETIGAGTSQNNALLFTGITAGAVTVSESVSRTTGGLSDVALVLNDGSGSIVMAGGMVPGVLASVQFAGSGAQTLPQFMNAYGPGTLRVGSGVQSLLSTGNAQTVVGAVTDGYVFAFGNSDLVNLSKTTGFAAVYGSNSTVSGGAAWLAGSQESYQGLNATITGANDTVSSLGSSGGNYLVEQASTVFNLATGGTSNIASDVSYSLVPNAVQLTLNAGYNSLTGASNTVGGLLIAAGNYDTLTGGSGSDTLTAQGLSDVLIGGSGHETFNLGNSVTNSAQLGSGNASLNSVQVAFGYTLNGAANILTETANSVAATGNSGNDSLVATGNYDTLIAGVGNDTLVALSSSYPDALVGGAGNNTFIVNNASDVVVESSTATASAIQSSVSFSLPTNVNALVVTSAASITVTANSGNDTVTAGSGTDTFTFNTGFGHDQILNAQNGDVIQFGSGISESSLTFSALLGANGTAPSLVIAGAGGAVTVQGGLVPGAISAINFTGGSNYTVGQLLAPSGRATVPGGTGNLIISTLNNDALTGGSGDDTIVTFGNGDTLNAGVGGSVIYAGGSSDLVTGGASTDNLVAIGAADTLVAGSGHETLTVNNSSAVINVSAGMSTDTVQSSVNFTVPTNVSFMTMLGSSALVATGNASTDVITGNSANDTLIAGSLADTLIGGSTADTFVVNNAADSVRAAPGATGDVISSTAASFTLPNNINSLIVGSGDSGSGNAGSDSIQGAYNSTLVAGSGNDTLTAYSSGSDYLQGGSGQDLMIAAGSYNTFNSGAGVDTLEGGTGFPSNTYIINNSADDLINIDVYDVLYTSVSYTLTAQTDLANESIPWNLTGTGGIVATDLTAAPVTFDAMSPNDTMVGGPDNNQFMVPNGSSQPETFIGGPTTNQFSVQSAADVVIAPAGSQDTITSYIPYYSLPTNINTLTLLYPGDVGVGNAASDTLFGDGGGDTLIAGGGTDSLSSFYGGDTLVAGTGTDTLSANSANELMSFNPGAFVLNSGFGNILIDGPSTLPGTLVEFGAGINASAITITAAADPQGNAALKITDGASTAILDGILNGDTYRFQFSAGAPQTLSQFLSQVTVSNSTVAGATGNVIVDGTASTSRSAGSGSDTIYATATYDTLIAGGGSGNLNAYGSFDSIVGGTVSSVLNAGGSHDTLVAGSGNDTLIGILGNATTYVVNSSSSTIEGQFADTIDSSISYEPPFSVGTLVLTGGSSIEGIVTDNDTVIANAGIDTLVGSSTGNNILFVINNAADLVIQTNPSAAGDSLASSVSYTLPSYVNDLNLTGTSALVGTANSVADTLASNAGVDTLIGNNSNDTYIVNNSADVIQDTSTSATNILQSTVNYTLPTDVNRLALIGTGNIAGTGNSANDSLVGGSGLDTLSAGSGTDTLVAGSGLTTLIGGTGNDIFIINNSSDFVLDSSTTTTNAVQASVSYSLATNVNTLTLTGTGALLGTANSGSDVLTSNTGVDTLVGGAGNDTFVINNANDVVQDGFTSTVNIIKSGVSYSLALNVNNLLITGSAAVLGTANSGNDSLTGSAGLDTLKGGAGLDTLVAGSGVNTLLGGAGNTTFVINNVGDVVQDTTATSSNTLRSSVTYVLPTNVNALVLTGTLALTATANGGNDTLTSNSGVDTLVGGVGNEVFIVGNASDVVQDTSATAINVMQSSVSYTLPTDVNALTLTGSTALRGVGNAANDSLTANSAADTLVAGNGNDTLVSSASGTAVDSLVGGTGTDLFVVNYSGDIVNVGSSHGADTIQSSASYTNAANVANLVLTGTGNLSGTGTTTASELVANSGADTLTAGTAATTLIGGSGNDTFVVNSASDVVQDGSITASNLLSSSVTYTLPTNVNRLILTGSAAAVGTANSGNDTLTANSGSDTLVSASGSAIDSLVGGTGADLFVVNNASDIVAVGTSHGVDTIQSSVSYSASTNVANLTLTGTSALAGVGNSLAGILTANSGADTLTAGTGADTLVGSTIGTDTFVVNSASDIVTEATSGTSDSIQSSASTYTLPTNVQYLVLTGSAALAGSGNSATSLLIGNTGNDTLTGGTGIAALEGGRTAGSDQIKAVSNQAALIAGGGSSTLTGGTYKDFYAAGKVSEGITTGATANMVSVNKSDGTTTLQPTSGATNVLSLGAGIDTESLYFTKTGNNLILTDGVSGDSITFANWYVGTADQNYTKLQVVEIASANYNSGGSDALRNKPLEEFNFTSLVAAYNTAGSPANWALSTAMPSATLASSATADYGGDLAYYFGLNGNLTGVDLSDVSATLTNTSYGTATQTINAFSSISGGTGLHLLVTQPTTAVTQPLAVPQPPTEAMATAAVIPVVTPAPSPAISGTTEATIKNLESTPIALMLSPHLPQVRTVAPDPTVPEFLTARRGLSHPVRTTSYETSAVSAAAIQAAIAGKHDSPELRMPERGAARSYVDPINLRWITLHAALDQTNDLALGGAETAAVHDSIVGDALVGGGSRLSRTKHLTDPGLGLPLNRERFL